MEDFTCVICNNKFSHACSLKRHVKAAHGDMIKCPQCEKTYTRKDSMLKHFRKEHINTFSQDRVIDQPTSSKRKTPEISNDSISLPHSSSKKRRCESCGIDVIVSGWGHHTRTNAHKMKNAVPVKNTPFQKIRKCFAETVETYLLKNTDEGLIDIKKFLDDSREDVINLIQNSIEIKGSVKFTIELFAEFVKFLSSNVEEDMDFSLKSFNCPMEIALQSSNLEDIVKKMSQKIQIQSEEFQERDSGWSLFCIKHIEVNINEYRPLRGSSFLRLPKTIDSKRACINVQNDDIYCFKWALISALHPMEHHAERPSKYGVANIENNIITLRNGKTLDFTDLIFPLKVKDISTFEDLNPSISINVFGVEKNDNESKYRVVGPYFNSKQIREQHINLLLIQEGSCNHYVWIKHMSALIASQINHGKRSVKMCNACLLSFNTEEAFEKHGTECNKIVTSLPNETNRILEFKNQWRSLKVPFTIYADFECILKNIVSCHPDSSTSSTTSIKQHVPIAVSYFIKCSFDDSLDKIFKYTGKLICSSSFFLQ